MYPINAQKNYNGILQFRMPYGDMLYDHSRPTSWSEKNLWKRF